MSDDFWVEARHYSDMGSEVMLIMNSDMAGDLAMALDPMDGGWRELSIELLEAVVDIDRKVKCLHEWVDMRNEVIKSGLWCSKCNAVRDTMKEKDG